MPCLLLRERAGSTSQPSDPKESQGQLLLRNREMDSYLTLALRADHHTFLSGISSDSHHNPVMCSLGVQTLGFREIKSVV